MEPVGSNPRSADYPVQGHRGGVPKCQLDSNDIRCQLTNIFSFTFDYTKKVSANNENFCAQCAQLQSYGIIITKPQQAG